MPPQRAKSQARGEPTLHSRKERGGASRLAAGPEPAGKRILGPTVSRQKQRAGARLPPEALLTCNSFCFAELGIATSSTGGSRPLDRGRGVLGGCEGWGLPRCLLAGLAQCGRRLPPRLLGPSAVVLTFTLAEEKATRALLQGCRHGLCQLRDKESAPRTARGQMGLALEKSWKIWSKLALGLSPSVHCFKLDRTSQSWICR